MSNTNRIFNFNRSSISLDLPPGLWALEFWNSGTSYMQLGELQTFTAGSVTFQKSSYIQKASVEDSRVQRCNVLTLCEKRRERWFCPGSSDLIESPSHRVQVLTSWCKRWRFQTLCSHPPTELPSLCPLKGVGNSTTVGQRTFGWKTSPTYMQQETMKLPFCFFANCPSMISLQNSGSSPMKTLRNFSIFTVAMASWVPLRSIDPPKGPFSGNTDVLLRGAELEPRIPPRRESPIEEKSESQESHEIHEILIKSTNLSFSIILKCNKWL